MKSTFISKEKNDVTFSMEFTAEEFENEVVNAYKNTKDKYVVDGFRKGKAPRKLIESRYGEDIFFDDALNSMISANYGPALDELDLNVVDRPRAEFSPLKKGEGFTVTMTVEVYPEFEAKDYLGVEIEKVEYPVTDENVQKEIETLQKRNSRMVLVDRPAKDGDTVLIDYMGFVGDNQFEGGTAERHPLKLGSGSFIPGFEEQLIGVSAGESKDVEVTFPTEYHSADLAGAEAVFKCVVHEIKEEDLPELNDEFAKDVSEFDTLDELKASIKERLEKEAASKAENQMKNAAIEAVFNLNEFDVPGAMVEEEIDAMIQEFDQQLRYQGLDIEKYFQYLQKDPAEFRTDVRDEAFKRVKTRMLISKIADQEDFPVSEEDVAQELERMASQYKMDVETIRERVGEENIEYMKKDIKVRKSIDYIFENAKIK